MTRQMKDSGVEWIGEIPEDWGISKLKYLVKEPLKYGANSSGCEFNDELPRYIRITDISKDNQLIQTDKLSINIDENSEFILQDGDILFARSGATVGKTFIYQKEMGLSGFAGYLIRARINKDNLSKYIYYITLSSYYEQWKDSILIQATIENIGADKYNNLIMTAPPKKEQQKIVGFLDNKTKEIENIIIKSKQAIEEYKRYKQALITETVTKGLDKSVPMKESGVEWIGKIPKNWNLIKFKDLFKFSGGLTITKSNLLDQGIKVINYGEIHSKFNFDLDLSRDELKCVDKEYLTTRPNSLVNEGDFVFCDTSEDRQGSGNCVVIRKTNAEDIFAGSHTVVGKLKKNEDAIYIRYMIQADSIKEQISSTVVGIKVYSITQAILKQINGILPPIEEQQEIADYLDKKTSQIDEIISKKEKLVEEMEAYKKSLIFETVTGKREVD